MPPQTVKMPPLRKPVAPSAPRASDKVITLAGLLTCGSSLCWAFPWRKSASQWHMPTSLAAYSCGGSPRMGSKTRTWFPFHPTLSRRNQSPLWIECAAPKINRIRGETPPTRDIPAFGWSPKPNRPKPASKNHHVKRRSKNGGFWEVRKREISSSE